MAKRWVIIIILALIIVIIASISGYFYFFYGKKCLDKQCFNLALGKCSKASWLSEDDEASWLYVIEGKKENACSIDVKLLQAKKGTTEIKEIEGLDMTCSLDLGYIGNPQTDLSKCSGKLKEEMQDLMIKKMHAYIISNIGKIGEELSKIV